MREAKVIEVQEIVFDDRQKTEEGACPAPGGGRGFRGGCEEVCEATARLWCSWSANEKQSAFEQAAFALEQDEDQRDH